MKNKLLFTVILITGFTIVFLGTNHIYGQTPKNNMVMKDTTMKYTCPHHPDVISHKPGKCTCGLEMVVLKGKDKMSKKTKKERVIQSSRDINMIKK